MARAERAAGSAGLGVDRRSASVLHAALSADGGLSPGLPGPDVLSRTQNPGAERRSTQDAGAERRSTRTRAAWRRWLRHEFWPAWLFYLPTVPLVLWLALRHRGLMVFSCCNPGIEGGGGIIGESKSRILTGLRDGPGVTVLPAELIPPGEPRERAALALRAVRDRPELAVAGVGANGAAAFPVILKPDAGYRGHAVRLARSAADFLPYFESMTAPAILQRFHPGPEECGIVWARDPDRPDGPGLILSVTRKQFPVLVGDGVRTLEALIEAHPRFRLQAGVFLERFARERRRVPAAGERVRLAQSGNHCQGTLFRDGSDLATPALADRIDTLARSFRDPRTGRELLDIGRFDIRYESDERLRAGEGLAVVELNGVSAEPTSMYDPDRSLWWAYRVLFRHIRVTYRLGAWRRDAGATPIRAIPLLRQVLAYRRARTGPSLAD